MKTIKDYNSLILLIENLIRKQLFKEGAGRHMAHPFDASSTKVNDEGVEEIDYVVKSGQEFLDLFNLIKADLSKPAGALRPAVKIDGVNTSFKLVNSKGDFSQEGKEFAVDRGSQDELDKEGITIEKAVLRFPDFITLETEDGKKISTTEKRIKSVNNSPYDWKEAKKKKERLIDGDKVVYKQTIKSTPTNATITKVQQHGMVAATQTLLSILNKKIAELKPELEKLDMWDNPNKIINAEYVLKSTNVKKYPFNFLALHNINQWKQGETRRDLDEDIKYSQEAMDKMAEKLRDVAAKTMAPGKSEEDDASEGFRVYSTIPSSLSREINYDTVLNEKVGIDDGGSIKTKTLKDWVEEIKRNPILDGDISIKDKGKTKEIFPLSGYILKNVVLKPKPLEELVGENKALQKRAIDAGILMYATMKMGQEVKEALESELGPVGDEEGVVMRLPGVPTFKLTGNFIVDKDQTPFQDRGGEEPIERPKNRTAIFPGSFKPPHRGHMSVVQHLIDKHNPDKVIIYISSPDPEGKNVRSAKITPAKAKKIFDEYVKAMNFTVPVHTVVSPVPQSIKAAYDYIETKAGNDEEVLLATSMADPGRYAGPYLKRSVEINPNSNVTARAVEAPTCKGDECDTADKISAGDIRKVVDRWEHLTPEEKEEGKHMVFAYMPDIPIERKEVIFRELIGEAPQEIEEPKTDVEEASGAGAAGGYAGGVRAWENRMNETTYNMQKSKLTIEEEVLKQYLVERFIKRYKNNKFLKEDTSKVENLPTGVAYMEKGLDRILKNIYDQHYTNLQLPEEKESFIAHFIEYITHAFAQIDNLLAWKREAGETPAEADVASEEAADADIEAGNEAALDEPVEGLEEAEEEGGDEEEITLDITAAKEDDAAAASAEDILKGKAIPEIPTEVPAELASMNAQGAHEAAVAYKNQGGQLLTSYKNIVDPNASSPTYEKELAQAEKYRKMFKDSFLTNFKLWVDRWKIQTGATAQERTTPAYEKIVQQRDATVSPPAAAAAPPPLEEAQIADIIKQSVIKTFRKLDYK